MWHSCLSLLLSVGIVGLMDGEVEGHSLGVGGWAGGGRGEEEKMRFFPLPPQGGGEEEKGGQGSW